jgi:hypothetical protein
MVVPLLQFRCVTGSGKLAPSITLHSERTVNGTTAGPCAETQSQRVCNRHAPVGFCAAPARLPALPARNTDNLTFSHDGVHVRACAGGDAPHQSSVVSTLLMLPAGLCGLLGVLLHSALNTTVLDTNDPKHMRDVALNAKRNAYQPPLGGLLNHSQHHPQYVLRRPPEPIQRLCKSERAARWNF